MPLFPTLKTGASAQYPLTTEVSCASQSVRFLDGSRQTYQTGGGNLRRWTLGLEGLDDAELNAIVAFLESYGDSVFSFVDPETGTTVPRCILSADTATTGAAAVSQANALIEIEEIP